MKKSISPAVAVVVIIIVLVVIFAAYKLTVGKSKVDAGDAASMDRPEGADSVGIGLQGTDEPESLPEGTGKAAPPP